MAIKTYSKGSKTQLSTNFKAYEFDCNGSNCCSKTKIDEKLVSILQKIRNSKESNGIQFIAGLTWCFRKLKLWQEVK
jgi:hypothetical protein